MSDDGNELEGIHKLHRCLARSLQSESNHAARAVRQIFLSQCVTLVVLQSAIMYPSHAVVLSQELRNTLGILTVPLDAQMERLQSEIQQESILWRGDTAQVSHQLCHKLGHIGHLSESLRIGQSVIRLIGGAESRELVSMGIPIKVTTIDDTSAHLCGVTVHIFRRRMRHDIRTPFERTAVDRCGEGVIDNQRNAVLMGNTGKLLDIENLTSRIRDGLTEQCLRIRTEGFVDFLLAGLLRDERTLDTKLFQRHTEKVVCSTVNFVRGDEMITCLADIKERIEVRSLSG